MHRGLPRTGPGACWPSRGGTTRWELPGREARNDVMAAIPSSSFPMRMLSNAFWNSPSISPCSSISRMIRFASRTLFSSVPDFANTCRCSRAFSNERWWR